jgi:DNA-directed RNA polymerase subunit RPC12/RpoP
MSILYTCAGCDRDIELDVRFSDGSLDDVKPEHCPHCGAWTDDENQIERRYEEKAAEV